MILSKAQQHVISKMRQGYELGYYTGVAIPSHITIQNGGCGKGGKSEQIFKVTYKALLTNKLIEASNISTYRLVTYKLTKLGETIKLTDN